MITTVRRYRTFSVFLPIFKRPIDYVKCKAVIDKNGSYSHGGLLTAAKSLAIEISDMLKGRKQERVAYFVPHSAELIIITWAIWMSGQIAVPLPADYPEIAHEYFIIDSDSNLLVSSEEHKRQAEALKQRTKVPLLLVSPKLKDMAVYKVIPDPHSQTRTVVDDSVFKHLKLSDLGQSDSFYKKATALIVYSSGTTPKGVVFTHSSLHAQAASLVEAWRISKRDCLLMALPMERGLIMMSYLSPLTVGSRVIILEHLKPENIWIHVLGLRREKSERPNIILTRSYLLPQLIKVYDKCLKKTERIVDHIRTKCMDQVRFFSVGNGPVTRKVFQSWEDITGHQILSRFSMTETGIIMCVPIYGGRSSSSTVGLPMPGLHVRITNENGIGLVAEGSRAGTRVLGGSQPVSGLLEVRGENILSGYWRKPTTTNEVMSRDGWFRTADLVKYSRGMYSILGKFTADIYRRGDQRYSIPLIEAIIMDNEHVKEVAVLENRLLDETKLLAFVVADGKISLADLNKWMSVEIPDQPIHAELVDAIPKNWSGKKNRQKILELFDQQLKAQYLKEKSEKEQGRISTPISLSQKQSLQVASGQLPKSGQPGG
ncbi:AMP-Hypothetical protein enzyme [Nesidiocoris tenuis]|uniref:AMP-dependent synthetase/ligase domain-containing protein n=1 Tax=Nesidiocoris tenuis TaxID=355587 RepID=A0ABN7A9J8_9HEMI|nr:AMP-Hypothetical protein enzyme [Nesidiocoris tenuis]